MLGLRPRIPWAVGLLPLLFSSFHCFDIRLVGSRCLSRDMYASSSSASSASSTSSTASSANLPDKPLPQADGANNRFWIRNVLLEIDAGCSAYTAEAIVSKLDEAVRSQTLPLPKAESAIVLIPSLRLVVPMHSGVVQRQHISPLPALSEGPQGQEQGQEQGQGVRLIVCGFQPRAQQTSGAFDGQGRQLDPARVAALDAALLRLGKVTGAELLAPPYAGTPPSRVYRSYICPHPRAVFLLEPIERSAERAAVQIDLALRQVRADQAAYLRNIDRGLSLPLSPSPSGPSSNSSPSAQALHPIVLVLDNIRSAFNVGSMFRTAETGGIAGVVTCGITAHPPHPKLRKTAFSSVDTVPTRHFDDVLEAIASLRQEGYAIVVLETTSLSQPYSRISYPRKVAIVLGNELTGVDARVIEGADIVAEIPTYGLKNSLNVASVAPVLVFEVLRQWNAQPNADAQMARNE